MSKSTEDIVCCIEDYPFDDDLEPIRSLRDVRNHIALDNRPAAIYRSNMWDGGNEIRVRFLEGSDEVKKAVKEYAPQWTEVANLTFKFVEDGNADVRITFENDGHNWSKLGRKCHRVKDQSKPTMNLDIEYSDEDKRRRHILHEFGHVVGLIHEHQSPGVKIPWNVDGVYEYYGVKDTNTDKKNEECKKRAHRQVLDPYTPDNVDFSDYDNESIMLYSIRSSWVTDQSFVRDLNTHLSQTDKKFASDYYPYHTSVIGKFTTQNDRQYVTTNGKYSRIYTNKPPAGKAIKVVEGLSMVDMGKGDSNNFLRVTSYAKDVTKEKFTLHVDTWLDSILYNASVSYLMIADGDPLIQTGRHNFKHRVEIGIGKLTLPSALEKHSTFDIYFDNEFNVVPKVFVGLAGWDQKGNSGWRLEVWADSIATDSFRLNVKTWDSSERYGENITWIAFPNDAQGVATGEFGAKVGDDGNWSASGTINFLTEFDRTPTVFTAFTKFDVSDNADFCCQIETKNVSSEKMDWSITKSDNTTLREIKGAYFALVR